jgi:hypothetical protein
MRGGSLMLDLLRGRCLIEVLLFIYHSYHERYDIIIYKSTNIDFIEFGSGWREMGDWHRAF